MRVLVVQNFDSEGLGQIGAALVEAGADIDLRRPYCGEMLPQDSDAHDAMVVLGGAQNALDDEICPYFPELLDLTRDFANKDRAVLGICLGSQLVARAFGGENRIGGASEFGWHKVSLTPAAKADPVLAALPENFPIFEWHDDTFALPEGAVRLAGNEVAENQAFRMGRAVYGFQFHFEADRPMVRDWSSSFASLIAERHPDWSTRLDDEMAHHGRDADAAGLAIARAWVATI
ncbi:MAG: GMP synthase [Mesorhizobium sp.]|uniref:type 1 glutamine amidotransferase n=2 Tax=Mesorhizobium TaxID=68287 RepID=UPI000FCBD36F|nr:MULTISPECIES: type 1 glutamine amidotransferase [unclassified Mesorhizobium]RUV85351.1 GMP synthase [Mesorhizobium sp. M5C.F.Ca.IN.020.14.1.1]RUV55203.1 GMP synthase [Mesorhizobium sp. M5C.F.Ca.IN.020.29.1.1]RWC45103.1 MAG: GMP synthase [Mesorhizobium sp.]RWD44830.1 MAG: GMP synthase [Mesorhizobium sp.]RWE11356.1 MAG: GMP synthase [Mesorhizobium sp.]